MSKPLDQIISALETLAPPELAESWDNTGLLIGPSNRRTVSKIMLTIDLTEAVLAEAVAKKVQMIVAYHPPIFKPISSLGASDIATRCIESAIAVYSPHTALDAAEGGVNDWLAEAFDLGGGTCRSIQPATDGEALCKVVVFVPPDHVEAMRRELSNAGAGRIGDYSECSYELKGSGTFLGGASTRPTVGEAGRLEKVNEVRLEMICPNAGWLLQEVAEAIGRAHPYEEPAWDLYPLQPRPHPGRGQGRELNLARPLSLKQAVERIKKHLGLEHLRVAAAEGHRRGAVIEQIMLCAGAGGSVLGGHTADLFWTGEMRHHDVLAANRRGTSVILTEHTHSERPYLPTFRRRLSKELGASVKVLLSRKDAEPLRIL